VLVLSWLGILALLMAVIPLVAISPILLYIGMLIGAQAFQETPKHHAPAIVLALIPNIAAWGKLQIDLALGAAGTNVATVGLDKLGQAGVLYHGLEILAGGAILVGMVFGAIGAFVVDKKYAEASYFAAAGAVLTFFGFMHGETVGFAMTPSVALAYAMVAAFLFVLSRTPATAEEPEIISGHKVVPAE